jgi:D-alanyl-D-alanine carboxypeptidase/D-alanyl-D-alanine-endopeptidase (penicillin-binding protein 4)
LRSAALLVTATLLLSACAGWRGTSELPAPVRAALAEARLPESALGVVAYPLDEPARALLRRADEAMQPGSVIKILTAAVALERLGPASRGRTELLADAPAVDGVLAGPLYLRGGGDAELDWGALWTLLRQLREQQGVRELRGGVVVDRSLFSPARADLGVPPFDETPEFAYNTIPDALHLNGSLLVYRLQSDAERIVRADAFPAWPGLRIDGSALRLSERPCGEWSADWRTPELVPEGAGQLLRLQGAFPRQCRIERAFNVVERQWLTEAALRQLWAELGGSLPGPVREGSTPPGAQLLALHQDRPLAEQVQGMLKRSDNPLARLLYLRLGAAAARPGEDSAAAAAREVQAWLAARGIVAAGLMLDNGSGLSRSERLSPRQLAAVLADAYTRSYAPELLAGLPLAGVDGTLARRLKGGPAEGRARLKTGTLRNVQSLAGYVRDAGGRTWVLVALLNDEEGAARGRPALDRLAEWVAQQQ